MAFQKILETGNMILGNMKEKTIMSYHHNVEESIFSLQLAGSCFSADEKEGKDVTLSAVVPFYSYARHSFTQMSFFWWK